MMPSAMITSTMTTSDMAPADQPELYLIFYRWLDGEICKLSIVKITEVLVHPMIVQHFYPLCHLNLLGIYIKCLRFAVFA